MAIKRVTAHGTCNSCGRFSQATGYDEPDALRLLQHAHGDEYKHWLDCAVTYKYEVDDTDQKSADSKSPKNR